MRMIDMHCDTLWKLSDLDGQGDLMKNDCHINIPSMKKAGTVVQLFACFTMAAVYKVSVLHISEPSRPAEMCSLLLMIK